jgi:hypothetical protein
LLCTVDIDPVIVEWYVELPDTDKVSASNVAVLEPLLLRSLKLISVPSYEAFISAAVKLPVTSVSRINCY